MLTEFLEKRALKMLMGPSLWEEKTIEWWQDERRDFEKIHVDMRAQTERIISAEYRETFIPHFVGTRYAILATLSKAGDQRNETIQQIIKDFAFIGQRNPSYTFSGERRHTCLQYIYFALCYDKTEFSFNVRREAVEYLLSVCKKHNTFFDPEAYDFFVEECIEDWGNIHRRKTSSDNTLGYGELFAKMVLVASNSKKSVDRLLWMDSPIKIVAYFDLLNSKPELLDLNGEYQCPYKNTLKLLGQRTIHDLSDKEVYLMIGKFIALLQSNFKVLPVLTKTVDEWIGHSKDPEQQKALNALHVKNLFLNDCKNNEDEIARTLASHGKIYPFLKDREARIKGKTSQEQELQDTALIKIIASATNTAAKSNQAGPDMIANAIKLISETGRFSSSLAVKKLAINTLNVETIKTDAECTAIACTTNDIKTNDNVQKMLLKSMEQHKTLNPQYAKMLLQIGTNSSEKAHLIAETFGKMMLTEFGKSQAHKENIYIQNICIQNTLLVQENLLETPSPTTVHILQKWIRTGHPIGARKTEFSPAAADNLHNAYIQLIANGKLSREILDMAYMVLARISEQHTQYRQDAFNMAQQRLLQHSSDPAQTYNGAFATIQLIGQHKGFALPSFNIFADLLGRNVQNHIDIARAITTMVQTAPFLAPEAIPVFENYLADHPDLDDEDSQTIFNALAIIARSNEDSALDIMDLLKKESARNPEVAQTALTEIRNYYPLYKNYATQS
jgi:hypothetical protein